MKNVLFSLLILFISHFSYSQCGASCEVSYVNQNVSGNFSDGKTYCISATDEDYNLAAIVLNNHSTIEICTDPEDTIFISQLDNFTSNGTLRVYGNAVIDEASYMNTGIDFIVESGGSLKFNGNTNLTSPTAVGRDTTKIDNSGQVLVNGNFEINNGRKLMNRPGGVFTIADGHQMNSFSTIRNEGMFNVFDLAMNTGTKVNTIGGVINIANDFEMSGSPVSTLTTGNIPPNCGAVIYGGTFTQNSGAIEDSASYVTKVGEPNGCTAVILPIELVQFSGNFRNGVTNLSWTTALEKNNDYFILEKSADGIHFSAFAEIDGAGDSRYILDYTYVDESPYSGVTYYRLKQVDFDGEFAYSSIISITTDAISFSTYPNPAGDVIKVELSSKNIDASVISVELKDILQTSQNISLQETGFGKYELNTSSLLPGYYLLKVTYATFSYTSSIVIQH